VHPFDGRGHIRIESVPQHFNVPDVAINAVRGAVQEKVRPQAIQLDNKDKIPVLHKKP
jgi:hypothetical protein